MFLKVSHMNRPQRFVLLFALNLLLFMPAALGLYLYFQFPSGPWLLARMTGSHLALTLLQAGLASAALAGLLVLQPQRWLQHQFGAR
jgi:hypothetical protein